MTDAETGSLHAIRFPNESAEYRRARDALLEAEVALRRQVEAVAALRRALPPGGAVPQDYVFEDADGRSVRLSELFGDRSTLIAYSFMFGPRAERPCPSCTSILDALDGAAAHLEQRAAFVAIARSPVERFADFSRERGWSDLRLLSSSGNSYNTDYRGEDAAGDQQPVLNVFRRDAQGVIRHVWASELMFAPREPGQDPRHVDLVWPLWNLLDLTPEGRGDFRPKLQY